jgi:alkylation response protein AidB-like acyl-CoA dehydrogenase
MNLNFTPEQRAYRSKLRQWIADSLPNEWKNGLFCGPDNEDDAVRIERDWDRSLFKAGYAGVAWPRIYGGQGATLVEQFILNEELGRVAAPEGINVVGMELVGPILLGAGSESQKLRYLPSILSADTIWCQGFSEPDAGSDLASLRTSAVRDGDHWVISGQKVWTTHARHANLCLLLARTDRTVANQKGLTLFIVPMNSPGITVRPLVQITGRTEFAEVFFDNVRIPAESIVGPVNEGWQVANRVLEIERGTMKLYRQARFTHEFEGLLRVAASTSLATDSHFRQRLASVYAELAIFRYHNLKLVARVMAGERIGADSSISKVFWSEMHGKLATLGFDALGARAAAMGSTSLSEGRFQELTLHARFETISSGTSQIQRNIIAERLLGLPR